jgi:hypothetical protein
MARYVFKSAFTARSLPRSLDHLTAAANFSLNPCWRRHAQKLAPYRRATDSDRPVYTIHDIIDREHRLVRHERLLLSLSRDGDSVGPILTSFEFICPDGAFDNRNLMTTQGTPPKLRLSATIEPHALG